MDDIILISILAVAGLGVFFAVILGIVNRKLIVKEDPKVKEIEEALAGLNCGACGFASCRLFAERIAKGDAANYCPVGGLQTQERLARVLGTKVGVAEKRIAVVHCGARDFQRTKRANYDGIKSCQAAGLFGGDLACTYGCLGLGDCFRICPFGAIQMKDGLPEIAIDKCTACGKCVDICPRSIISLEVFDRKKGLAIIACRSQQKATEVKRICEVGCIGCRICEKKGPLGVFKIENNLAQIDYKRAKEYNHWGEAAERCPTNTIVLVK